MDQKDLLASTFPTANRGCRGKSIFRRGAIGLCPDIVGEPSDLGRRLLRDKIRHVALETDSPENRLLSYFVL